MPLLDLTCQSLHITCIFRAVLWRADTKWCVSESFRNQTRFIGFGAQNQTCLQDGLQPDVCSINTAIASCKDSGRTCQSCEQQRQSLYSFYWLSESNYTTLQPLVWLVRALPTRSLDEGTSFVSSDASSVLLHRCKWFGCNACFLSRQWCFCFFCLDYQNVPAFHVSAWFRSHDIPMAFGHGQVNGG